MVGYLLRRVFLLVLLLSASGAWAACSVNSTSVVSLGSTSSLALITTPRGNNGGAGLRCSRGITLGTTNYLRVTLQSTDLVLTDGKGNSIPFRIFESAGSSQLQPNVPLDVSNSPNMNMLGSGGGLPLYFRVPAGSNVPAGTYRAKIRLRWQYAICTAGVLGTCFWDRSPGLVQSCLLGSCGYPTDWGAGEIVTVSLSLIVSKACVINSVPSVDMGSNAFISQFSPVSTTIGVTCTNTEGYTIGFDNGQYYQAPWRRLATGEDRINYNIYFPGTNTVWTISQTQSAIGSGEQQSFRFDTVIDPHQANVPVGTYIDNVTLVIKY